MGYFTHPYTSFAHVAALLISSLALLPSIHAAQANPSIERIVDEGRAAQSLWGIYAVNLSNGEVVADINGEKLFVPASNRKLVSTALAASVFDADDRFTTTLHVDGVSGAGLVSGDMVLDTSGDPSWTPSLMSGRSGTSVLRDLAKKAGDAGIKRVQGNLVIEARTFSSADTLPPGWVWNDLSQSYAGQPSVLSINNNLAGLRLSVTSVGNSVGYEWAVPIDAMPVINEALTSTPGSLPTIHLERELSGHQVTLSGNLPANSQPSSRAVPLGDPSMTWGRLLRYYLQQEGIRVAGSVIVSDNVSIPSKTVASYTGASIATIMNQCNQESDNFLAESLYLLSAAKRFGRGSYRSAYQLEESFWEGLGIDNDEIEPSDGSGLSRENFITPRALVALLEEYRGVEWFVESLPVSGRSGTLRYRLSTDGMTGRVRAKTGTLTGASALSGYVTTNGGDTIAFSIMVNHYTTKTSWIRGKIDSVVKLLAR